MFKASIFLFVLLGVMGCKKNSSDDQANQGEPSNQNCSYTESFTDPRDLQVYPIVVIGNQTWMAKNLNYAITGSWCHNCALYGRLYSWGNALTIAPPGWHLPTVEEWDKLVTTLGGYAVAGGKLKNMSGWRAPNSEAINSRCFSALPGAYRASDGQIIDVNSNTAYWTTLEGGTEVANAFLLGYLYGKIQKTNFSKAWGLSVRCIKD